MELKKTEFFDDNIIGLRLGNWKVNIIYIHYMAPDPGWIVDNHCHSTYELHIIPKGSGSLYTGSEAMPIEAGDLYITGPGIFHRQKTNPENPMVEYCINFEIHKSKQTKKESSYSDKEIDSLGEALLHTPFWLGKDSYGCAGLAEKIYDELQNKRPGCYTSIKSLLTYLLICLARSYRVPNRQEKYELPVKTLYENRAHILDSLFYTKYDTNLTIEEISKSLFVSKRQLYRIIEKRYGMSFKEKLNSTRIKNAKVLLEETVLPVGEIAVRTGFSSADYFIRVFKKYEKITPLKYRTLYKKPSNFFEKE